MDRIVHGVAKSQTRLSNFHSNQFQVLGSSSLHCWWDCKLVQSQWKTLWRLPRKLKSELPYDLANPLLGIYVDKTIIQNDTLTSLFTTTEDMETTYMSMSVHECPCPCQMSHQMWSVHTRRCCSLLSRPVPAGSLPPWTAARQASLPLTVSRSLPKFMSTASVMPSSRLIL